MKRTNRFLSSFKNCLVYWFGNSVCFVCLIIQKKGDTKEEKNSQFLSISQQTEANETWKKQENAGGLLQCCSEFGRDIREFLQEGKKQGDT